MGLEAAVTTVRRRRGHGVKVTFFGPNVRTLNARQDPGPGVVATHGLIAGDELKANLLAEEALAALETLGIPVRETGVEA